MAIGKKARWLDKLHQTQSNIAKWQKNKEMRDLIDKRKQRANVKVDDISKSKKINKLPDRPHAN